MKLQVSSAAAKSKKIYPKGIKTDAKRIFDISFFILHNEISRKYRQSLSAG